MDQADGVGSLEEMARKRKERLEGLKKNASVVADGVGSEETILPA